MGKKKVIIIIIKLGLGLGHALQKGRKAKEKDNIKVTCFLASGKTLTQRKPGE